MCTWLRFGLISLGFGLLLLGSNAAAVDALQEHQTIRAAAETHARDLAEGLAPIDATVQVTAARLDSRLRLPACGAELESFTAAGQTGIPSSVGVRCLGTTPWSIYVPVQVEVITPVVVLVAPGVRGQPLLPTQLRLEPRDVSRMTQDYFTSIDAIGGMVLKRQIRPGTVLSSAVLEAERVVRRGERVRLSAGSSALAVSVEGEALADAARGQRVRVRNIASGIVVEGIAEAAGLVVMTR